MARILLKKKYLLTMRGPASAPRPAKSKTESKAQAPKEVIYVPRAARKTHPATTTASGFILIIGRFTATGASRDPSRSSSDRFLGSLTASSFENFSCDETQNQRLHRSVTSTRKLFLWLRESALGSLFTLSPRRSVHRLQPKHVLFHQAQESPAIARCSAHFRPLLSRVCAKMHAPEHRLN